MPNGATWIKWNKDEGVVESSHGRLIIIDSGFIKGFYDELKRSGGTALGKMIINDLGRDMDIKIPQDKDFLWDDFEAMVDKRFESFDSVENMPPGFTWDGKGRTFQYMGAFTVRLWPVKLIGSLKASAAKSLTPRGAQAIIGLASRRAGRLMGEVTGNGFGWNTLKTAYDSLGEVMTAAFTELGWGKFKIIADYERLMIYFILRNSYEIAAEGKDANLTIVRNQIEGVGEYLSEREGMKSRSREYTLDDGTDARVIVVTSVKPGSEVDWDTLEWRKMVA
jgi:hypothetical protein